MDLITLAIPGFFASMGYEAWWLKQRAGREGPSPVDYETKDTLASLTMGLGSLVVPLATKKLSNNLAAPSGKWVRRAVAIATASAAAATAADAYRRRNDREAGSVEPLIDLRRAADSADASSPVVVPEAATDRSTVARFAGGAAVRRSSQVESWQARPGRHAPPPPASSNAGSCRTWAQELPQSPLA